MDGFTLHDHDTIPGWRKMVKLAFSCATNEEELEMVRELAEYYEQEEMLARC